ncbi:MAG: DUF951 domain-containing protein [Lachnospiraceae bacterium]|nr:DUF951 domain-containing protein [Lachnospiraceae bacterium]
MELTVGDILYMKKAHPCGAHEWELLRVGQDLKIKCCGCGHLVMAPRRQIEKNIKKIIQNRNGSENP